jgi:ribosome maturation factor RimP
MSRQTTVARVEEVCERVGQAEGLEIVEVELKGSGRNQLLRIFIDKPGGVTHDDCESVSHKVGDLLDAEDILPGHYVLEVSSPGVERKLKKPADFQRFQGQKIRVVMREPVLSEPGGPERKSRFVEGVLAATEDSGVFLETVGGERLHIPFEAIDRANLKFEW